MTEQMHKRVGSAEIAGILRREISKGTFVARDRLPPERTLAESYSVARGTIREALNQLAAEGLVEIRPGSGTYVAIGASEGTNPMVANAGPLELIDARFALEPHICRLAVLHGRQQDFDRMERLMEVMEAPGTDSVLFANADTEFHSVLAETTGNGLLIWIVSQINSVRNQEQWAQMRHLTLNHC